MQAITLASIAAALLAFAAGAKKSKTPMHAVRGLWQFGGVAAAHQLLC